MGRIKEFLFLLFFSVSFSLVLSISYVDYVDPIIGTANSGQTFPAVGVPFGTTLWSAETRDWSKKCTSPYYYEDGVIQGFRASHWWSGACTQDYASFTVMPVISNSISELPITTSSRKSPFSSEVSSPYYYSAYLLNSNITAELTASTRVGLLQFDFPLNSDAYIVLNLNTLYGGGWFQIKPESNQVVGRNVAYRIYQGDGTTAGFSTYFTITFENKITKFGIYNSTTNLVQENDDYIQCISGEYTAIYVGFSDSRVQATVSTSFSDIDHAQLNEQEELQRGVFEDFGSVFARVRSESRAKWEEALSKIEITTSDYNKKVIFYTAMYHTLLLPRIFSDTDGTYPSFGSKDPDQVVLQKASGYDYYADFSLWDTFRALHPLFTIIQEDKNWEMMQSLVNKAEQGLWMPVFPGWNSYTQEMIGDHVISIMSDAILKTKDQQKELPPYFDVDSAFFYLNQNCFQEPMSYEEYVDGKGRRALHSYIKNGFIPLEDPVDAAPHDDEQVSRTLEYSYDDYAMYCLSISLNTSGEIEVSQDTLDQLYERGTFWKNVYDPDWKLVRGKHVNGSWSEPYDPTSTHYDYITEGSPWQYSWFVPHDIESLVLEMGGQSSFINNLDYFFDQKLYNHGNEPGHHVYFLYNYVYGYAWKTQSIVRTIIQEQYSLGPYGLPGNDDGGQMSAWLIFAALGFYPVSPGVFTSYVICSPLYDSAKLKVSDNLYFTVNTYGNSDTSIYIEKTYLNGQLYNNSYIEHKHIMSGSTLDIYLSSSPNQYWGINVPPSMSSYLNSKRKMK